MSTTLDTIADAVDAAAMPLVGVHPLAGVAAKIAGMAIRAGARIAAAGGDPVVGVERLLSAQPVVADVHDRWEDAIAKLPRESDAPDTLPGRHEGED
jgi:hypothetical protein